MADTSEAAPVRAISAAATPSVLPGSAHSAGATGANVSGADVVAAAERIVGHAVRTPLLESARLNAEVGRRVLLKAENLQRIGAFKFRGAFNAIAQLDPVLWPGGVVACSSGNHAQGVADAARLLGYRAAIVMPADSPRVKVAGVRRSGGEVIFYDRAHEDRYAIAHGLAAERQAAFVPPFDHPHIVAGQGTVGLEIVAEAKARGLRVSDILVPVSGGGLLSGIAVGAQSLDAAVRVRPIEPEGFDDFNRSLAAGARLQNPAATGSICDALLTPIPGELTFRLAQRHVTAGAAVTDDEVQAAMRFAFDALKLVVEPGGAVALASVLRGDWPVAGTDEAALPDAQDAGVLVVVLSGGNVDPEVFQAALSA